MTGDLQSLCKKLDLDFQNFQLLQEALTHRSAGARNNERLEFLGDAVLGFIIAHELFHRFPHVQEGELSRMRATLVNQTSLAALARQLELGNHLILGPGELKSGGFRRDSILSDALEAVMGALLEDQGIDTCRQWVLKLFESKLEALSAGRCRKDPKTRLQEFLQSRGLSLPRYEQISQRGAPHDQIFEVACHVTLLPEPGYGKDSSRKRAEQRAAAAVLENLSEQFGKAL
ncbi:ribonuclease III [Methylohalobius crimeensis]|uniref:ribonuclease III n=1 Tax=Methylohalobius crimeensis TaxID=244365 RepID=UPI0003B441C8|nr:ribonuclease III [Methylohalobius crimeensis]